jgi:hypothetical protein
MTACGNVATSSAQVRNVARKPCAVIRLPLEGSIHRLESPAIIRFNSVSSAMLESGLFVTGPGNTKEETRPFCIRLTMSTARADRGTRNGSLRCFLSFRLVSGIVQTAASRSNSVRCALRTASVRAFVRMRNSRAPAATASRARSAAMNFGIWACGNEG